MYCHLCDRMHLLPHYHFHHTSHSRQWPQTSKVSAP
ncbi:unnamed protein product [Oppiella nova]|uniref:Uncharacterized protein n=1 Tax=Oppiella nova TaxID=334625 RepID=A0A7R9MC26_9ACAR|nr:unnamed protein product [Oppiella nova]CAG2174463.1 unnamed protein product [Oppiella nova]